MQEHFNAIREGYVLMMYNLCCCRRSWRTE